MNTTLERNIWTFGHSTRTADETVELLRAHGIEGVVDVRTCASSKHCPQHVGATMQAWLEAAGIWYGHLPSLGGHRGKQDVDPTVNAGWTKAPFRNYADWTLNASYRIGIRQLESMAEVWPVAYFCSEAVPWRCHRSLISDTLTARGWTVHHILSLAEPKPHVLGGWGATPHVDGGRVTYPAAEIAAGQMVLA